MTAPNYAVIFGVLIIGSVLIAAIAATAWVGGWRFAALVWGLSLTTTAVLAGGVALLAWGLTS